MFFWQIMSQQIVVDTLKRFGTFFGTNVFGKPHGSLLNGSSLKTGLKHIMFKFFQLFFYQVVLRTEWNVGPDEPLFLLDHRLGTLESPLHRPALQAGRRFRRGVLLRPVFHLKNAEGFARRSSERDGSRTLPRIFLHRADPARHRRTVDHAAVDGRLVCDEENFSALRSSRQSDAVRQRVRTEGENRLRQLFRLPPLRSPIHPARVRRQGDRQGQARLSGRDRDSASVRPAPEHHFVERRLRREGERLPRVRADARRRVAGQNNSAKILFRERSQGNHGEGRLRSSLPASG